jgi:hypothetical protein
MRSPGETIPASRDKKRNEILSVKQQNGHTKQITLPLQNAILRNGDGAPEIGTHGKGEGEYRVEKRNSSHARKRRLYRRGEIFESPIQSNQMRIDSLSRLARQVAIGESAVKYFTENPQSMVHEPFTDVFVTRSDSKRMMVTGDYGIYELALEEALPRHETLGTAAQEVVDEWHRAFPKLRPHSALHGIESAILKLEQFLP